MTKREELSLDADRFWEVIEKLFLHTSSDEKIRTRHNLSLSALCRTQALPPLPRPQTKKPCRKLKQKEKVKNKTAAPNGSKRTVKIETGQHDSIQTSSNSCEAVNVIPVTENDAKQMETQETETTKATAISVKKCPPESVVPVTMSKSECSLNDLHVQLVKDATVPASERLWRFAMRNKKRTDDNNAMRASPISRTRSNEAIYKGLRERLEEAEREAGDRKQLLINTEETEKDLKRDRNTVKTSAVKQSHPKRHTCPNLGDNFLPFRQTASVVPFRYQNESPTYTSRHKRCEPPLTGTQQKEAPNGEAFPVSRRDFNERRMMYDKALRKRLRCGSKLESLNKELKEREYPRILQGEVIKNYKELKSEYLRLCHNESQLKHHIAMLNAEIYMMQNKGYHKKPAAIKTITLDSKTPLNRKSDILFKDYYPLPPEDAPYFPPLKPTRPLGLSRSVHEKAAERTTIKKQKSYQHKEDKSNISDFSSFNKIESEASMMSFPDLPDYKVGPTSICSLYSLEPETKPPPSHEPELTKLNKMRQEGSLIKLIHRLPKLKSQNL